MMEADKNPFPESTLFRFERTRRFIARVIRFYPLEAPNHMSEHYHRPEPPKIPTQAEQAVYASLQRRMELDIDDLRWEATHGDEPPLSQLEIDTFFHELD